MDEIQQSDLEVKMFVMHASYWLFMSCKFRDSISGFGIHPFHYFYEPITFKRVLDYGIGIEATDLIIKDYEN